jgi:molybdopterin-biosynthesis enzyme MoeA-like protein
MDAFIFKLFADVFSSSTLVIHPGVPDWLEVMVQQHLPQESTHIVDTQLNQPLLWNGLQQ